MMSNCQSVVTKAKREQKGEFTSIHLCNFKCLKFQCIVRKVIVYCIKRIEQQKKKGDTIIIGRAIVQ